MPAHVGSTYDPWYVFDVDKEKTQMYRDRGQRRPYLKCRCIYCGHEQSVRDDNLTRDKKRKCPKCRQGGMDFLKIQVGMKHNNCIVIYDTGVNYYKRGNVYILLDTRDWSIVFRGDSRLRHDEEWHSDLIVNKNGSNNYMSEIGHKILKAGNIWFQSEYYMPTCTNEEFNDTKRSSSFDEFVPQWHCFIEWDDKSHLTDDRQKLRDKVKFDWCIANQWNLIRIPESAINDITILDLHPITSKYRVTPLFYCGS